MSNTEFMPELHPYSSRRLRAIIQKHPSASMAEIARLYDLNYHTVLKVAKENNIAIRSPYTDPSPENVQMTISFMKKHRNYTNRRLSKVMGVHPNQVALLRKKYKIFRDPDAPLMKESSIEKIKHLRRTIEENPEATIKELSNLVDMSYSATHNFIQKYDLPYEKKLNEDQSLIQMLDPQLVQQVCYKYPELTLTQVGEKFGVSETTIRRFMSHHKIKYKMKLTTNVKDILTVESITKLKQKYPSSTRQDCAKHFGVALSTFNKYTRVLGLNHLFPKK